MRFVETPVFTKEALEFLADDEYRALLLALLFRPGQGAVIPGSGGLRKLRFVYKKNVQEDLTPTQLRMLSRLVREEFK